MEITNADVIMVETRKEIANESAAIANAKSALRQNAIRTTEQFEFETRFKAMCEQSLLLIEKASNDHLGLMEVFSYLKLYALRQRIQLNNVNLVILEKDGRQ